jgi:hypothetical protein
LRPAAFLSLWSDRLKTTGSASVNKLLRISGFKFCGIGLLVLLVPALAMSACQPFTGFSSQLDPEVAQVAVDFAQALVDGDFELANSLLAPETRSIMTPEQLRLDYEGMISFYANPGSARVVFDPQFTMTSWPDKRPDDVGWVYVSIAGDGFVEAVTVIIADYDGELLIREIEWGRP